MFQFSLEGTKMAKAFWQSSMITLVVVIAIKWLTGLAYLPLMLVALLILALSIGLSLRLDRARRRA